MSATDQFRPSLAKVKRTGQRTPSLAIHSLAVTLPVPAKVQGGLFCETFLCLARLGVRCTYMCTQCMEQQGSHVSHWQDSCRGFVPPAHGAEFLL